MNITTKITLDCLCKDSVSILKQNYINVSGVEIQIGENHRRAFVNSESGRTALSEYIDEPYLSAVFSVWGDTPTVIDSTENKTEE